MRGCRGSGLGKSRLPYAYCSSSTPLEIVLRLHLRCHPCRYGSWRFLDIKLNEKAMTRPYMVMFYAFCLPDTRMSLWPFASN